MLWPRRAQKIGGTFALDLNAADISPGEKRETLVLIPNASDPVRSEDIKLYVVRFDAEQAARNPGAAEGSYLALWRKCPHLGCTIPWVSNFTFTDPLDGQNVTGWFRCPCHGSTYTDAGPPRLRPGAEVDGRVRAPDRRGRDDDGRSRHGLQVRGWQRRAGAGPAGMNGMHG